MDLFDLAAKITLDSSGFNSGIDEATKKGSSFGDKLNGAGKVAAAGIAAATAAIGTVSTALVKGAADVASYGDNIDKMSQKMGMSAESYQEWDAVMQHSGTSMETMKSSMKTLANAAQTGNDAFAKLGITQEQIASMSQEELFGATIEGLQNVTDITERTYLSGQLLGRGATELGALLNTSAEDTQAMKDRVHELGGVMSNEGVKAAARYQDSLQDMRTAFSGLKNNLVSSFLPSMSTVMDGLGSLMAGEGGAGETLTNGINDFISNLSEVVPKAAEVGGKILAALTSAITQNLPQIFTTAADVLIQFANGIISAFPDLTEAGIEIITTLATSIAESLPELIPAAIDCIIEIAETLTDPENLDNVINAAFTIIDTILNGLIENIPRLVQAGLRIILKLVDYITTPENIVKLVTMALDIVLAIAGGIVEAIPELISAAGEIVSSIWDTITETDWLTVGKNVLEGIWNGIKDKVEWLKGKVSGVVDTIKGWFTGKEGFDEHSPSKWSKKVFEYVLEGGANGLDDYAPKLYGTIENVVGGAKSRMDFGAASVDFSASATGKSSAGIVNGMIDGAQNGGGTYTINLIADGNTLASVVFDPLNAISKQRGVALGNA